MPETRRNQPEPVTALASMPRVATSRGAPPEATSERLLRAVSAAGTSRISIGELIAALGDRAFGLILLILTLPNCVPVAPPGIGGVTGTLIAIFAVQMLLGKDQPWLPDLLKRRSFDRAATRRMLLTAEPYLRRFERICRPRLLWLTDKRAERPLGAAFLLLALVVSLPIPFTNWPSGLAIAVIAAGFIERDGVAVLLGLVLAVAGTVFTISVAGAVLVLITNLFSQATG